MKRNELWGTRQKAGVKPLNQKPAVGIEPTTARFPRLVAERLRLTGRNQTPSEYARKAPKVPERRAPNATEPQPLFSSPAERVWTDWRWVDVARWAL